MLAIDLYGAGRSPQWPSARPLSLAEEVALLAPVLASTERPFHLIGHSYGGAVALRAALTHPEKLASLIVFEPVLFSLLMAEDPDQAAARMCVAMASRGIAARGLAA